MGGRYYGAAAEPAGVAGETVGVGTAAAAASDPLPRRAGASVGRSGPDRTGCQCADGGRGEDETHRQGHRVEWVRWLARVFKIDVTVRQACGGHMRMIAVLTAGASVYRYLEGAACRFGHRPSRRRASARPASMSLVRGHQTHTSLDNS